MLYLVLLLALVLRLVNLNQSLWLDEAVQAITAKESFSYIFQEILGDFHPPLYHFLMHFWVRLFGTSEIALRMPSVLFGVGTVYLVYKIAKQLSVISDQRSVGQKKPVTDNRSLVTIAAIFMASAPFHIYYSQEARMYSMACFFATLSVYFFIKVISYQASGISDRGSVTSNRWLVAKYLITTVLLIYSDYFGFLVLAAQLLILFLQKKYKFLVHCSLFIVLTYLPWIPMFIKQLQVGSSATTALPEWGRLVNLSFFRALPLTFVKFSIGRITIFNKLHYLIVSGVIFVVYGSIAYKVISNQLSVIGDLPFTTKIKKLITDNWSLIAIAAWSLVPLLLAWGASIWVPNFQPFRLLLILPAFYLLLALGIGSVKSSKVRIVATAFVLAVNLLSLFRYYSNPYFHREDWKGLTAFLAEQKNAATLLPSETSNWPIKYYDQASKINLNYGSKGITTVTSYQLPVTGNQKIYYVRYLVPLFDPEEKILQELQASNYSKIKEISFNQIEVWEFKRSYQ
jgi:4-amino-4-deoxy-L-arabinose transferase-like glycosyltransferase